MATTDSPLKQLLNTFSRDFATWLLHSPVQDVRPLPTELPGETLMADQVFQVTLADGQELIWHVEFQGRRSHEPMPWRMLAYMARLAYTYRAALVSVVLYVGFGAGTDDAGMHEIAGFEAPATLTWRYRSLRLWQMPAEELLALGQPALLALVGQTHLTQPEVTLPAVVAHLRQVSDRAQRGRLFTAFLALLPDEEMLEMVENLLESEDVLLDTPYLRRLRAQAQAEGYTTGQDAGRIQGLAEGRAEGRAEGQRQGEIVLLQHLLQQRFGPLPAEVETRLQAADTETLLQWSERLLRATTLQEVFAS